MRLASVLVVIGVLLAACGSGTSPAATSTSGSQPESGAAQVEVAIRSFAFDPSNLSVKAGTTVNWTNDDNAAHTVSSDGGDWKSGNLSKGQSFSHTFTQVGTFTYHCSIHPSMTATIVFTE